MDRSASPDWSDLNPSPGVYNWTALNSWIAANQANDTQMVYTFVDPPAWAGGANTNLADFQAFVTAIVTQANGAIKYWEGFNEFNVSGVAPALLVQMQEIIYNTVHALDPGALVLSPTVNSGGAAGNFADIPCRWRRTVLRHCRLSWLPQHHRRGRGAINDRHPGSAFRVWLIK